MSGFCRGRDQKVGKRFMRSSSVIRAGIALRKALHITERAFIKRLSSAHLHLIVRNSQLTLSLGGFVYNEIHKKTATI